MVLRVTVNKAEHLPAMDLTGLSDPFCKLKYEGKKQKTQVIRENLNPEWNESFDFDFVAGASLEIDVYDWDLVGSNDFMGTCVIHMSAVTHHYSSAWHPLQDDKGNTVPFARINIGVQMMTPMEAGIAPVGKNVSLMSAVFGNLKPILFNLFRMLYIIVRPIMLELIVLRKMFLDWENPLQTIVASFVFLYCWWYNLLITMFLLLLWWGFTMRMWQYKFFKQEYVPYDYGITEKDMLKRFKETKIELKYGKDDPIAEDVQKVARITAGVSRAGLKVQFAFNWQGNERKTIIAWVLLLVLALGHSYVPWRFIFYWIIRIALFVGWFAATIMVPVRRVYPTGFTKVKRFLTHRGFLSHLERKYTTPAGSDTHAELPREQLAKLLSFGAAQTVRTNRVLEKRGQWFDLFFYPISCVLRTGHTTHVKAFIRPTNVLLQRLSATNPGFDMGAYCRAHLDPVVSVEAGKLLVFDVNMLLNEMKDHPNLALCFYRWLGYQLTKKHERSIELESAAGETSLFSFSDDESDSIHVRRDQEKKRQMLASFREKFQVSSEEPVLHIQCDVFKKSKGKKFYGNVFVTKGHLAFLPATNTNQAERWIVDAADVETAFVNKVGALEIRFCNNEVRHLFTDDSAVLLEVVSSINHMKTSSDTPSVDLDSLSGELKRVDVRARAIQSKSWRKSMSQRVSLLRTTVGSSAQSVLAAGNAMSEKTRDFAADVMAKVQGKEADDLGVEEIEDVEGDGDEIPPVEPVLKKEPELEGVPEGWKPVRITELLDKETCSKLLDERMKKVYKPGSEIVTQDSARLVAVQILWKGEAVAVRKGGQNLVLGQIHEGSLFGETAYLLEAHAGACVVAVTECIVYTLPGPWLDGLFDMDRNLGARFFEAVCLILLERSFLTEFVLSQKNNDRNQTEEI